MPYLHVHTNVEVPEADAFLAKCSRTVAEALGKPESYVMVELSTARPMMFAGSTEPLAYMELKSLGMPAHATAELSARLCGFIEQELGISQGRVYIEFSGPERHMWGWDGGTF